METIGQRIKYLRDSKKLSMGELEKAIGSSNGSVNQWEKDRTIPGGANLIALSNFFGVSVDWILKGDEGAEPKTEPKTEQQESPIFFDEDWEVVSQFKNLSEEERAFIKQYLRFTQAQKKEQQPSEEEKKDTIREEAAGYAIDTNGADEYTGSAPIWGEAAAGIPIESIRMYEGKRLRVPAKYNKCFAVKVKGDSMKDSGILNGGYVIVRSQNMVDDDDIALMMIENQATIKRFHLRDNDVVLISDNDDFEPMVFHRSKEMQVVGKVVYYIRPEEAEIIEEWSE